MNKKIGLLLVVVVMVLGLVVAGCAPKAEPEPGPAPTTAPTAAPTAPTPAPEDKVIKWAFQTSGSIETPAGYMQQALFDDILIATDGRLEITQYPGGAIVPAYEEIEGVETGAIDMGSLTPSHERNRVPSADLFTCRVSGMDWRAIRMWYQEAGGFDLLLEAFEEFPVQWFPSTMQVGEVWAQSTVELTCVEDLNGLKMRCRGDAGGMLNNLGMSTVFMPAGEIYEALSRGVIDLAEMDALASNWPYGYHEICQYLYLSKARAQASPGFFVVYNGSWDKLSAADQMTFKYMTNAFNDYTSMRYTMLDMEALQKFIDYGCIVEAIPCDINSALRREANKYYAGRAAEDPFFAKVLKSQDDFYSLYQEGELKHMPVYCDEKLK